MFTDIKECISFIESQHRTKTKSLQHMKTLCSVYGNPERGLPYIHVAGTNGKGSVVSYLREIFVESGYNVGTFTSPYIEKFNERITYNKKFIPDCKVIEYANEIISKYDYLNANNIELPGFFSFITLMCFMYFRDLKPDVVILEAGIGGLLDDTNVIENPILTIISNISYDHMSILGNTLEEIGKNKLGIVKEGTPLVTIENEEINDLIVKTCKDHNSLLKLVNKDDIKNPRIMIGKTIFDYKDYKDVTLQLSGLYQTENASIVIEACELLKTKYTITKTAVMKGLKNNFWPGRMEVVRSNPYIILDGAHNIDGIQRLHEFIKTLKGYKIILALAISSNKETCKMIREIEKDVDKIIFTSFNYRRSEDYNVLYDYSNHKNKEKTSDVKALVDKSLENKDEKTIWLFSGSLYFVSEIRKMF